MGKNSVKKVPDNEKYGFVYLWFDKKHKRYYVGCHWGTEDDGYICSSRWMRKSYNRRKNDFKRRIISRIYTNRSDLIDEEYRFLQMIKPEELKIRYYNLHNHYFNHWSTDEEKSLTLREKISKATKEAMKRPEVRQKYEDGLKNRDNKSSDPEVAEKRRQSMIKTMAEKFPEENRKHSISIDSEEYKENMREKTKAYWENMTEEDKLIHNEKLSNGLKKYYRENGHPRTGQKNTAEHTKKISDAQKGVPRPQSSEKLKEAWVKRKAEGKVYRHKAKPFFAETKIYDSMILAEKELNVHRSTIYTRLKSDKYIDYYYIKE
jgi:hypothetical protein